MVSKQSIKGLVVEAASHPDPHVEESESLSGIHFALMQNRQLTDILGYFPALVNWY